MLSVNQLKSKALHILLDFAFSYTRQQMYLAYTALAHTNAKIQGAAFNTFFAFKGVVYPDKTPTGVSITNTIVKSTPLHYSLLEQKTQIDRMLDDAQFTSIRNFLAEVLKESYNGIVLEELLPHFLISELQAKLSEEEYTAINDGTSPLAPPLGDKFTGPTVEETLQSIQRIKQHYQRADTQLKRLLTERFFLQ